MSVTQGTDRELSPPIYRCGRCGALVHPGDPSAGIASCARCRSVVPVLRDGGALP